MNNLAFELLLLTVVLVNFGSTRSQVRILSPRLNQIQFIQESFSDSLFYCQQLERWDLARFERGFAMPCINFAALIAQNGLIPKCFIYLHLKNSSFCKSILVNWQMHVSLIISSLKVYQFERKNCKN